MYNSCAFVADLKVSDCAAWVQAWGTMLALAVAIGLAAWQHRQMVRREARLELQRRLSQMTYVIQLGEHAIGCLHVLPTEWNDQSARQFAADWSSAKIFRIREALSRIDHTSVPSAKALTLTHDLILQLGAAEQAFGNLWQVAGNRSAPAEVGLLRHLLTQARTCIDETKVVVAALENLRSEIR
ncbi:MAG: hypothetical protein KIS62_01470 [Ramlibacter sp.]|nr:hypothetical protein [Ramlibacter sp.]